MKFRNAIISRLKIMAKLDIAEKRKPQDGRITLRHKGQEYDLRVSVIPMADIPHPLIPSTRDLLRGSRAQVWFLHLNHTNAELGAKDVARDGARFGM